jgi:hypothetical protein
MMVVMGGNQGRVRGSDGGDGLVGTMCVCVCVLVLLSGGYNLVCVVMVYE